MVTVLCASLISAYGNTAEPNTQQITELVIVKDNPENGIYEIVQLDEQPQFPGGINGLMEYLASQIIYPSECAEADIQGKVLVKFTVFKDGTVGNVEIVKSAHPLLDAEAIRVVESMPKWTPGKLDGQTVNVWYTLPVNYKLQGDAPSMPVLSERDQADFDNFLSLGNQALSDGNTNHAYQYFKECFNIKPTEFYLIEKVDSILATDKTQRNEFHSWAGDRLMREIDKTPSNRVYLDNMIALQNIIISDNPDVISNKLTLAYLYSINGDETSFNNLISQIYSLTENTDPTTFASAVAIEANPYYNQGLFQETLNIIEPKLAIIKKQSSDLTAVIWLSDVYLQLNRESDAIDLLKWVKANNPTFFNQLMDSWKEAVPEYYQKLNDLTK